MSDGFYRPIFRRQIGDPTTTRDSYICTMTSGAMALDYHTLGRIQVWGGDLEKRQDDHVGGTDLNDLKQAWAAYGATLEIRTGRGWAGVMAALREGRGVVLQGDYDQMGSYSCQPGFGEGHAIYLNPSTIHARGYVNGDPLCTGWTGTPEHVLRAYAEKWNPGVSFAVTTAHLAQAVPSPIPNPEPTPPPVPVPPPPPDCTAAEQAAAAGMRLALLARVDARIVAERQHIDALNIAGGYEDSERRGNPILLQRYAVLGELESLRRSLEE